MINYNDYKGMLPDDFLYNFIASSEDVHFWEFIDNNYTNINSSDSQSPQEFKLKYLRNNSVIKVTLIPWDINLTRVDIDDIYIESEKLHAFRHLIIRRIFLDVKNEAEKQKADNHEVLKKITDTFSRWDK